MVSINKAVANNLIWVSGISFPAWLYQIRPVFTNKGGKCRMLTVPPRLLLAPGAAAQRSRGQSQPGASQIWSTAKVSSSCEAQPCTQQPGLVLNTNLLHTKSQEEGDKDNKTASQGVVSLKKWGFTPHNITITVILRWFAECFRTQPNPNKLWLWPKWEKTWTGPNGRGKHSETQWFQVDKRVTFILGGNVLAEKGDWGPLPNLSEVIHT